MNKMKGKLEEEKERHLQTKLQLEELTVMVNNLQQLVRHSFGKEVLRNYVVKSYAHVNNITENEYTAYPRGSPDASRN